MAISKHLLKSLCPDAKNIIEAGIFDGKDTKEIASMWPSAKIWGFEPVKKYFEIAKEYLRDNKNVSVHNIALAPADGKTTLYISGGRSEASSSIIQPKEHITFHPDVSFSEPEEVDCANMDNFCDFMGFFPDIIWFDLQGAEHDVLISSPKCLSKVTLIAAEVSFIETYKGILLADEFEKKMNSLGFETVHKEYFYKDMGDILFKKKV